MAWNRIDSVAVWKLCDYRTFSEETHLKKTTPPETSPKQSTFLTFRLDDDFCWL